MLNLHRKIGHYRFTGKELCNTLTGVLDISERPLVSGNTSENG